MAGKQNLSPKEIQACENYLRGMSLRKALLAAGYSPNYCEGNAHLFNWLKRRHICSYIRQRQVELSKSYTLDKAELIKYARHILQSDDPRDRTKALEILMRLGIPMDEQVFMDKGEAVKAITFNIVKSE